MRIVMFLFAVAVGLLPATASAWDISQRLKPYKTNYAIYQGTSADESSLEVQYSFKYILYGCNWEEVRNKQHCGKHLRNARVYLAYTGEFDFYVNTRPSGPVINRTSNPAGFVKLDLYSPVVSWLEFGLQHRSDGQATEIHDPRTPGAVNPLIPPAYASGNVAFFDTISRGANFVSLAAGHESKAMIDDRSKWGVSTSAKIYFSQDSAVNWGPLANKGVSILDYDIVNLSVSYGLFDSGMLKGTRLLVDYMVGRDLLKTDSADVSLLLPVAVDPGNTPRLKIPFYIRAHFGPMDRLSDYTRVHNSVGAGLAFSY